MLKVPLETVYIQATSLTSAHSLLIKLERLRHEGQVTSHTMIKDSNQEIETN